MPYGSGMGSTNGGRLASTTAGYGGRKARKCSRYYSSCLQQEGRVERGRERERQREKEREREREREGGGGGAHPSWKFVVRSIHCQMN